MAIVIVASAANPYILIPLPVILILFMAIRWYYLKTSRSVKRLEAIGECVAAWNWVKPGNILRGQTHPIHAWLWLLLGVPILLGCWLVLFSGYIKDLVGS